MNISRFNNQKGVAHLFLLIVLLLGLGAGIYLVTQTQIFKPKASDPNANLSQGLVGYWKFDETTGTTVADSSGNNNTGTWKASTGTVTNQWVPGKFGNAGNFNGSTTFVSVNNNPSVAITGSLTIAGWVKRADPKKFSYGILTKGNVSSASNNAAYGLFLGATDQYALRVSNTGKTPINISTSKTYSNLDVWDHVVGVYTAPSSGVSAPVGAQGTLDIYINGQLAGKQVTNAPTSLFNNSAPVTIGSETADNGLPTWFWNGQLDEIRLYNRALSSSEVFQLYSYNPNAGSVSAPVSPNPSTSPATRSIKITYPNGGETFNVGDKVRITWDSNGVDTISLLGYSALKGFTVNIAESIPNTGSYEWTVNVGSDTNKPLKIDIIGLTTGQDGSVQDQSDNSFTVNNIPSPSPVATSKRVFVTSTKYNGNLGGLSGADAKCQERANTANLGGTWKAWLSSSDANSSPALRFNNTFNNTTIPYKLLNGTVIAKNWKDLTDWKLDSPINLTELGTTIGDTYVWTNTSVNGYQTSSNVFNNCTNWTWGYTGGSKGYAGITSVNGTNPNQFWTYLGDTNTCDVNSALYCFEQ